MTTAGTSTRTPMSTGLVRTAMPSRRHSSTSQAAPWRPGARITASALMRLPSVQVTPVAAPSRTVMLATVVAVRTATRGSRSTRMALRMPAARSLPMWRTGEATRVMPCTSAWRRMASTLGLMAPWTSAGAP